MALSWHWFGGFGINNNNNGLVNEMRQVEEHSRQSYSWVLSNDVDFHGSLQVWNNDWWFPPHHSLKKASITIKCLEYWYRWFPVCQSETSQQHFSLSTAAYSTVGIFFSVVTILSNASLLVVWPKTDFRLFLMVTSCSRRCQRDV